jgi:hypothetical protein
MLYACTSESNQYGTASCVITDDPEEIPMSFIITAGHVIIDKSPKPKSYSITRGNIIQVVSESDYQIPEKIYQVLPSENNIYELGEKSTKVELCGREEIDLSSFSSDVAFIFKKTNLSSFILPSTYEIEILESRFLENELIGKEVCKLGCSTGYTLGSIVSYDSSFLCVKSSCLSPFAFSGDSGSVLLDRDTQKVLGLIRSISIVKDEVIVFVVPVWDIQKLLDSSEKYSKYCRITNEEIVDGEEIMECEKVVNRNCSDYCHDQ